VLVANSSANNSSSDREYVKSRVKFHTIIATSNENFDDIPDSAMLHYAFRYMYGQVDSQGFNISDQKIIEASYTVRPSIDRSSKTLFAACRQYEQEKTDVTVDGLSLARQLNKAHNEEEEDIASYYLNIVTRLSLEGQQRIQEIINEAEGTSRISYSSFDVEGYNLEFPDFAEERLSVVCGDLPMTIDARKNMPAESHSIQPVKVEED